jgi:hypothetical protein
MNSAFKKNDLFFIQNHLNKRKISLTSILNSFKTLKYSEYDIFLSHRYKDRKFIEVIFIELSIRGYSVYVDWICNENLSRKDINRETAQAIRDKIEQSKCLIYVTTEEKNVSKWMPWECGYMDAFSKNVAILPITDSGQNTFKGEEFLSLYPLVKKDSENNLIIELNPSKSILFDDWIKKRVTQQEQWPENRYYFYDIGKFRNKLNAPAFGIGTTNIRKNIYSFRAKDEGNLVILDKTNI